MRNITGYAAKKYLEVDKYTRVEDGVYLHDDEYVTSLSFVQEPELGEGVNASAVSQYPLEDLLDEFLVDVSDSYEHLNVSGSDTSYLEFSSPDVEGIRGLRGIIGKHVFNRSKGDSQQLVIE